MFVTSTWEDGFAMLDIVGDVVKSEIFVQQTAADQVMVFATK